MKHLIIIWFTLLSLNVYSQDCPSYRRVKQGQQAPCDGYFFNKKGEKKVRTDLNTLKQEKEKADRKVELKDLQIKVREQQAKLWEEEARRHAEERRKMEGDYKKGILIGAGGAILLFIVNSLVIRNTNK